MVFTGQNEGSLFSALVNRSRFWGMSVRKGSAALKDRLHVSLGKSGAAPLPEFFQIGQVQKKGPDIVQDTMGL